MSVTLTQANIKKEATSFLTAQGQPDTTAVGIKCLIKARVKGRKIIDRWVPSFEKDLLTR